LKILTKIKEKDVKYSELPNIIKIKLIVVQNPYSNIFSDSEHKFNMVEYGIFNCNNTNVNYVN